MKQKNKALPVISFYVKHACPVCDVVLENVLDQILLSYPMIILVVGGKCKNNKKLSSRVNT